GAGVKVKPGDRLTVPDTIPAAAPTPCACAGSVAKATSATTEAPRPRLRRRSIVFPSIVLQHCLYYPASPLVRSQGVGAGITGLGEPPRYLPVGPPSVPFPPLLYRRKPEILTSERQRTVQCLGRCAGR